MLVIALGDGVRTVTFSDTITEPGRSLVVTHDAISGLWSAPSCKTSLNERQTGNGAHDVHDGRILYSARTVSIPFSIITDSHDRLQECQDSINMMMGKNITMTVQDGSRQFTLTGYVTPAYSDVFSKTVDMGTITVVCPRPEKLGLIPKTGTVFPTSSGKGGLYYGDEYKGLVYPLGYGKQATDARNVITLSNDGNTYAYPTITVTGESDYVQIDWTSDDGNSNTVSYNEYVGTVPLVLDSRSQTANIGGTDMSRNLGYRGFPTVPPKGSVTFSLTSPGTGWADIVVYDTYI